MHSSKNSHKLLLIAVLALAILSPLMQTVGAQFFFDRQVILQWKSDPALRSFLANPFLQDDSQVRVLLVFLEVPSPQQIRELYGFGTLESFTGHVATMHLPRNLLPQVASLDFVERVSFPRSLSAHLDKSLPEILADGVWETMRDADGNPVNGTGIVVGVVDTGIDYTHKDFFFKNGPSKILYLWDQSVHGKEPHGFDYGNECTRQELETKSCSEFDGIPNNPDPGHGTAVAAVAASSGQAATLFESCLRYDGTRWYDDRELCRDPNATPTTLLASSTDERYFGNDDKFNQIFFDLAAAGKYGQLEWEYSQGSGRCGKLNFNLTRFNFNFTFDTDETAKFSRNNTIFFKPPGNWSTDTVDGVESEYWIRVKTEDVTQPALLRHVQTNPPYFGVAPGALIISVKLKDGSEDHILDGINYIMRRAGELGLSFVVNLSFGYSLGSHDGTELLEFAMTDLASDGVPIIVPAGNSRFGNGHISGKIPPGQPVTVAWSNDKGQNRSYIDLWYSVSDVLGISVKTPDGVIVTGPTPESGVNTLDGNVIILPDKRTTGKEWWVNVTSTTGRTPQMDRWSFTLTGVTVADGKWDAWTEPGQFVPNVNDTLAGLYKIDQFDTIDSSATARGVITVGAYMTRYYWRSGCTACIQYTTSQGYRGVWWTDPTFFTGVGNITYDSGMGPTRDGRMKPEITAPGANIVAARASNIRESYSDPDNYHKIWYGTSLSAPHVTGVVALMLQMNPYLSPNEIKTILTEDARQDKFTGVINKHTGLPLWGWGKVDALNSTRDAPTLYSVRVEIDWIGKPFTTNLTLDGQHILRIPLNQTKPTILEFQRGGNHTIELSTVIEVEPGVRYILAASPWTFSSGGVRRFHYQLQFLLQVTSGYGYTNGTGWYDANSTAVASVNPTIVQGHQFQGWIGAISSDSPTVELRMDSSKEIVAVWRLESGPLTFANLLGLIIAALLSVAIALVVRKKYSKRI